MDKLEYNRFVEWINREIERRSWIQADFARKSGLSTATVSDVLSGKVRPGLKFVTATIRAFGRQSANDVLMQIGLLPPMPMETAQWLRLSSMWGQLSTEDQGRILDIVEVWVRKRGQ